MAPDDEDLIPQSPLWYERLARQQRGYFYAWRSALERGNGEDLYTEWVERALTPSLDVVDAGCGHGLDVLRIAPRVRSVLGYDRMAAFIDLAEEERCIRGVENAHFLCADSKGSGIPVFAATIDLFLSRRGPRNWIVDAGRAGRPGAVLLMLCPIAGDAPDWNDELPAELRLPAVAEDHPTRLRPTMDAIQERLVTSRGTVTEQAYCEVDELFDEPREFHRYRVWGRDAGLVPSYEQSRPVLERIFERHAADGKLHLTHRRWIWRATLEE